MARSVHEFVDSLFWENPLRNDYDQYGMEMMSRFRKAALCSERGEDIIRFVKAMDAQGGKWKADDYWKRIIDSYLPSKVFRLNRLVSPSYDSTMHRNRRDNLIVVNLCYRRINNQRHLPAPRNEIDKKLKVYFRKLGVSTKGIKFK